MTQPPIAVSWSFCGDAECIRLAGLAAGAGPWAGPDPSRAGPGTGTRIEVRPVQTAPGIVPGGEAQRAAPSAAGAGRLPAMAGEVVRDGADLCFLPRFRFLDGTAYTVTVGGAPVAVLARQRPELQATTEVAGIWPTADQVPRNLLRLYVLFSAPMSEGYAAGHVQLTDDAGRPVRGALLRAEHELWDSGRRRLTVLLDPARIKRGLAAHGAAGYALHPGRQFCLVVDDDFRDAAGARLRAPAQRHYQVGGDERRRVDPATWRLAAPAAGTAGPLEVFFGRPLDHGLLGRCLQVTGPAGDAVSGMPHVGPQEQSWRFTPREPWAPGPHQLLVDPVLEDLAGNSVTRVFDRDLASAGGELCGGEMSPGGPAAVAFLIRPAASKAARPD